MFPVTPGGSGKFVVPEGIDYLTATLTEPITCALGAVQRGHVQPGNTVVVIGLGGLGQLVAHIATSAGAQTIGIDIMENRTAVAAEWCDVVLTAGKTDIVAAVLELTKGIGVDIVFEVVGRPETFLQAFDIVRLGGRVVLVGVHSKPVLSFHPEKIFRKDIEVVGAKVPMPIINTKGEPLAFGYLEKHMRQLQKIITAYPFTSSQAAFADQLSGKVIKAVIDLGSSATAK